MSGRPSRLTEADVLALEGTPETVVLEFKDARLLADDRAKWMRDLTKELSAFANTHGGRVLIGVGEKRSLALQPEGVEDATLDPASLQRALAEALHPDLPGLQVYRVRLSARQGYSVVVIDVPQGTTAYQAADRLYYGRWEHESKPLVDRDIRLRMFRGRLANARVEFTIRYQTLAERDLPSEPMWQYGPGPDEDMTDRIEFRAKLVNNGEVTIREAIVALEPLRPEMAAPGGTAWPGMYGFESRRELTDLVVFPSDATFVTRDDFLKVRCRRGTPVPAGMYVARWTVFLDNAPPCSGEVDVGLLCNQARQIPDGPLPSNGDCGPQR